MATMPTSKIPAASFSFQPASFKVKKSGLLTGP
jgi:hypothetical protein